MTIPLGWLGTVGKLRRAKLEIELALESIESGEGTFTAASVTCKAATAIELLREMYELIPKKTLTERVRERQVPDVCTYLAFEIHSPGGGGVTCPGSGLPAGDTEITKTIRETLAYCPQCDRLQRLYLRDKPKP